MEVLVPQQREKCVPKLRVCVLSSSYEGADSLTSHVDDYACSPKFWLKRDLNKYEFTDIQVKKDNAYTHVRELVTSDRFDVFYNLCDGAKDEKRAGVDVVKALEELNAAFTGADSKGFEPSKIDMKVMLCGTGVLTPNFALLESPQNIAKKCRHLKFPVIVKHVSGYASVGITKDSKCETLQQLDTQVRKCLKDFKHALVEEFITGREGTVFVCPDPNMPQGVRVFQPLLFSFLKSSEEFNHFDTKWDHSNLGGLTFMDRADPCNAIIQRMARSAFLCIMNGVGYGRCDFRIDSAGKVYFLEINANCGMLYDPSVLPGGDYADRMVDEEKHFDGYTYDDFIATQINSALATQRAKVPWFGIGHDGNGQVCTRVTVPVHVGTPLFGDVRYPIPVIGKIVGGNSAENDENVTVGCLICRGDGINTVVSVTHSCDPNMYFVHGQTLTFVASRALLKGEILAVDFSTLRDASMPAFYCSCGAAECRVTITSDTPVPRVSQQHLHTKRRDLMTVMRHGLNFGEKRCRSENLILED